MLTRSLSEMDRLIVEALPRIRQLPFDVIVHLPRSGTIPASLMATYLRKPLASLDEYIMGVISTRKCDSDATARALLVDDSIRSGVQMTAALDRIMTEKPGAQVCTLAVFSTEVERDFQPDLVLASHEERTYIYPWFMWKTGRIKYCAVDMDGVLCRDCLPHEDDDGEEYLKFLETAEPKFLTSHTIGAIVTSRLKKYRPQTEAWLSKHGVSYKKLIMGPWESKEERRGKASIWKAKKFKSSDLELFVESDDRTARIIKDISGKPVWSVERMECYR
jgi:hypoxanthine phosphoribosyltransferase